MSKAPSFQFYPGDWLKDPALRLCTPAARGAWIDLLCFMAESEDRGVLMTNGRAWSVADAARAVGCPPKFIRELLDNGVARQRDDGAIYSARMVKDERIRRARAEAGAQGGNPNLLKQNPSKPEANREQTREQKPTPSSSSSSSSSSSASLPSEAQQAGGAAKFEPPSDLPDIGPITAAIVAWGAGTIGHSAASRVALVLDTLAREHPIPDAKAGTDADPQAVCLALIADMRTRPETPGPTQLARLRAYADSVLRACAAEGRMPGEFDPLARTAPISEYEKSRRDLREFAKTLGAPA